MGFPHQCHRQHHCLRPWLIWFAKSRQQAAACLVPPEERYRLGRHPVRKCVIGAALILLRVSGALPLKLKLEANMTSLISEETAKIQEPTTLGLLITAIALIPAFIFWVGRQERLGRPAIIPNSLWRNRIFSIICIGVFITWGTFNAVESYHTLFFQNVQKLSAIQTSIRFLPGPVAGALANVAMGLIAHRVRADWAVAVGLFCTTLGGLLMCIIQPEWSYWSCAFLSVFFNPIGADALFTVSNLVITSVFPARTQGLAGGVFNTVAQIGKSVGLATSAVIASSVTEHSVYVEKESPAALMEGFRAAFWYLFALSCATGLLLGWGLRGIGRVGMKRE
jgi:nitrate/nitrite transporter NarK